MSAQSITLAGRRAAERNMTQTWAAYRLERGVLNPETAEYEDVTTTIYSGRGKTQSFEPFEEKPDAGGHSYTVMRQSLHLPVNEATGQIQVGDFATCLASPTDPELVGSTVVIVGVLHKAHATARRFQIEEAVA